LDGNSNPYCEIKIGEGNQFSCIEKTRKIKNTKNPAWKEVFTLNVNNPMTETLFVEVMNKESRGKDNSLGFSSMMLNDLTRGIEKQVWLQLEGGTQASNIIGQIASHLGKKKDKVNNGKVFLGVTALDFGLDPSTYPPGSQMQQQGIQQPGLQQQPMQQPGLQQQPMQQQSEDQQNYPPQQPPGMQPMQQQPMQQNEGQQNYPQQFAGSQQQQQQQQPGNQPNIPQSNVQGMQQPGMQQPGMQYPPSGSSYDQSGSSPQDVYPKTL